MLHHCEQQHHLHPTSCGLDASSEGVYRKSASTHDASQAVLLDITLLTTFFTMNSQYVEDLLLRSHSNFALNCSICANSKSCLRVCTYPNYSIRPYGCCILPQVVHQQLWQHGTQHLHSVSDDLHTCLLQVRDIESVASHKQVCSLAQSKGLVHLAIQPANQ